MSYVALKSADSSDGWPPIVRASSFTDTPRRGHPETLVQSAPGEYDSWVTYWVIQGTLAKSPRPGYSPGAEHRVSFEVVESWCRTTREFGIESIICLLDRDQLPLYNHALPDGLVAHYETHGFKVAHVPTFDGQTEPFTAHQYEAAWLAFQRLPKPVLVHCSAGFDRTGRIVEHIQAMLKAGGAG